MKNYNTKDIRFYAPDAEGDFAVDATGDFALTEDYESAKQDMANRIRTQSTDWRSHPRIGADLELLEGEPNTRETGAKAEAQVYRTLTYDNRFDQLDLTIRSVPTNIDEIEVFSILNTDSREAVIVKKSLDL
jgi:hypothetical protein